MALCFLSGLALAGFMAMPVVQALDQAIAKGDLASDPAKDCDHHAPKAPNHGHGKMDCCAGGYCPMLALGLLPSNGLPLATLTKSLPSARKLAIQPGLASAPTLRPPRSFI